MPPFGHFTATLASAYKSLLLRSRLPVVIIREIKSLYDKFFRRDNGFEHGAQGQRPSAAKRAYGFPNIGSLQRGHRAMVGLRSRSTIAWKSLDFTALRSGARVI